MKHIGILAHSAEGATLCYRTAWMEGVRRLGAHMHPEITLTGVAMAEVLDDWESNNLPALRAVFMRDADKLAAAGADFFVCPDNTAHIALESPGEPFPIPCLHIAEAGEGCIATIEMPEVHPLIAPLVYAVPVQLLAYHVAVLKGTDVDQPRNLAKSVTVE